MKTYTIESIQTYDSNKEGKEYRTKDGDRFLRVVLNVKGVDDDISLLDFNNWSKKASEGDQIQLENFERDDYGLSAEFAGFAGDQTAQATSYTDTEKLLYLIEEKLMPKVQFIYEKLDGSDDDDYPEPNEDQTPENIDQAFDEYAKQEENTDSDDADVVDIDF